MQPSYTRLRHVSAKSINTIEWYLSKLEHRVQIYGINHVGGRWYLHFVGPDDVEIDLESIDIKDTKVTNIKSLDLDD